MTDDETLETPPEHIVEFAVEASVCSPCRSKRGVAIFRGRNLVAHGFNYKPRHFECDGSEACKATCRDEAVHAEQQALLSAGVGASGALMLHVKTVEGRLVPSGGPSCVQCSKLALVAGIKAVWLYHESGWRCYPIEEFHEQSLARLRERAATHGADGNCSRCNESYPNHTPTCIHADYERETQAQLRERAVSPSVARQIDIPMSGNWDAHCDAVHDAIRAGDERIPRLGERAVSREPADPEQFIIPHLLKELKPDCCCAVCEVLRESCENGFDNQPSAVSRENGWQPIATAPKDGTRTDPPSTGSPQPQQRFARGMNADDHDLSCAIRTSRDGWDADCTCRAGSPQQEKA